MQKKNIGPVYHFWLIMLLCVKTHSVPWIGQFIIHSSCIDHIYNIHHYPTVTPVIIPMTIPLLLITATNFVQSYCNNCILNI